MMTVQKLLFYDDSTRNRREILIFYLFWAYLFHLYCFFFHLRPQFYMYAVPDQILNVPWVSCCVYVEES